jgi:hypothetical protein
LCPEKGFYGKKEIEVYEVGPLVQAFMENHATAGPTMDYLVFHRPAIELGCTTGERHYG